MVFSTQWLKTFGWHPSRTVQFWPICLRYFAATTGHWPAKTIAMQKHIAVVTGGDSGEFEISVQSADNVLANLNQAVFRPWKVLVTGANWRVEEDGQEYQIDKNDFSFTMNGEHIRFEGVFLILHGTPGEDGKLQGYFDMLEIPYTGCNVATSSVTFNKGYCTAVARAYGFKVANSVLLTQANKMSVSQITNRVGLPCFVKPNNGGSSIGISKVNAADDLQEAIDKAFGVDGEVLVEAMITGTEVTCGVANYSGEVTALGITECVFETEFFDFHAKYADPATQEITPARISPIEYDKVMRITEDLFRLLNCSGLVRIDYIIQDGEPVMIEVNTIPGLTAMSLIPKQAAHKGVSLEELYTGVMQQALNG